MELSTRLLPILRQSRLARSMDQPINLVDIGSMTHDEITSKPEVEMIYAALQAVSNQKEWSKIVINLIKHGSLESWYEAYRYDFVETFFDVIINYTNLSSIDEIVKVVREQDSKLGEIVMTLGEKLRQEGRQEGEQFGLEKGIHLGKHEAKRAMALEMIKKGYPIDDVTQITGLSLEVINEIKASILH